MSYTLIDCPNCQGEISTYFGPEGYDGTCVNCGCHIGNLFWEPKYVPPQPTAKVHVGFKVCTLSRVIYREGKRKVKMPVFNRDYIHSDESFTVEVPKEVYGRKPQEVEFLTDLQMFIEKVISEHGAHGWEDTKTGDDETVWESEYVLIASRDDDTPVTFSDMDEIAGKVREQVALKYKLN